MSYTQLGQDERYQIYELLLRGWCQRSIAQWMRRSPATISRELKRNRGLKGYRPRQAHQQALARRVGKSCPRIDASAWQEVERLLQLRWRPEQISRRLQLEGHGRVSHEWIYQYIYQDKRRGGRLFECLPQQKAYRKRLGKHGLRGRMNDTVSIEQRPKRADSRRWFGHWEGDTVVGKDQRGALVTLVERKSRFTLMRRVTRRKSQAVKQAVCEALLPLKDRVQTITYDNGKEFSQHKAMASVLEADMYFAHPYASWERGTNENTNRLIRQFFPKSRHLNKVDDQEVAQVQANLNHRPRKCLGYRTPYEIFFGVKYQLTVALTS